MYVFCYQFHIRGSKQTNEKHIQESISLRNVYTFTDYSDSTEGSK